MSKNVPADYISRKEILRKAETMYDGQKECSAVNIKHIYTVPSEDVAPVVYGEWVFIDHDETGYQVMCSHCCTEFRFRSKNHLTKYCSECGAKMIPRKTYTLEEVKAELGLE